jgi:hypothetical protein
MLNRDRLIIDCEEGRPRVVNGQEIPNWQQGPKILGTVQRLGWKGWELVSDRSALKLGYGQLIFRRLKKMRYL